MIKFNKAILRVLLVVLTTGALTLSVKASGDVRVKPSADKTKAIVSLAEINSQNVTLSIENLNESVIYYSKFIRNSADFRKTFDFSLLEDGEYLILVSSSRGVVKKHLVIKNSEVFIEEAQVVLEPVFRIKDKSVLLFHNNDSEESYAVNFYNDEGNFFTDKVEEVSIAKKYDLSKLQSGSYTVSLSNDDDYFTYNFDIE